MSDLDLAIRTVEMAPQGPTVGAFFDLDGTLVKGFTAFAFLREELRELGPGPLYELAKDIAALRDDPESDLKTIERAAEMLQGRSIEDLEKLSSRVFRKRVASTLRPGARDLIRAHKRRGHTVVMATAATRFQAQPVQEDLEIPHLISTEVEVEGGRLTGRVDGAPRWGVEKARGVEEFAAEHAIDLQQSFAYGNGAEDRDFLEAVGRPTAVCPDRELAAYARRTGVPVLKLPDPPPVDLRSVVGTLGAMSTFNAGVLAAVGGKLISGGRWKAIGPTLAFGADMCLKVAGVSLRVQGREFLEAVRPAVFIVNHQSNLDPAVAGSLIRHDFTGVGKAEVGTDPRSFAMQWLDIALIDRSDSESARRSVNALVDRIRGGESVVIWPEGTRMPTQRLGPFKKGAFHLAMSAGVPLIPIVLRNTGELWPRGKAILRAGTVDVCVLPPIPTADWTRDDLDEHVAEVRGRFARTLESWPKG